MHKEKVLNKTLILELLNKELTDVERIQGKFINIAKYGPVMEGKELEQRQYDFKQGYNHCLKELTRIIKYELN